MNDLLYQMTFDVLKDIGFGQANEEVKDGADILGGSLTIIGPTNPAPWLLNLGFPLFPRVWNIPRWFRFFGMTQEIVMKRIQVSALSLKFCDSFLCLGGQFG